MEHGEIRRTAFPDLLLPTLSYGLPFIEACQKHVEFTFDAHRIYIIASKSLSTDTDALERLEEALGNRVVGKKVGITSYTLWSESLKTTAECRDLNIDLIITIGGGSLTDAAKIVALALSNNATSFDDLSRIPFSSEWASKNNEVAPAQIPIITIPTTLSGVEYQNLANGAGGAGGTGPSLVILDADLTTTTPNRFWLSTGISAVDHCVETLCSLDSHDAGDRAAARGLQALVPGLLRCKRNGPNDLEARHMCQMGTLEAMSAVRWGAQLGASHGIGHQLGPLGVGHGETSCILLPAVCWYNRGANAERQEVVEQILWMDDLVRDVLIERGLLPDSAELDDMLDAVISELGMPRTLRAVGVGAEQLDALAESSLTDNWCQTNPIPLTRKEQVLEILEMVVE